MDELHYCSTQEHDGELIVDASQQISGTSDGEGWRCARASKGGSPCEFQI